MENICIKSKHVVWQNSGIFCVKLIFKFFKPKTEELCPTTN